MPDLPCRSAAPSLENPVFSDLTLCFDGQKLRVHKFVLASKSTWFARALQSEFKEAKENEVNLEDDDPKLLRAMLEFIYDDGFDWKDVVGVSNLVRWVELWMVADKYGVPKLQRQLEKGTYDMVFETSEGLLNDGSYAEVLAMAYDLPDAVGHNLCLALVRSQARHLTDILQKEPILELLKSRASLGRDMLSLMSRGNDTSRTAFCMECPSCSAVFAVLDKKLKVSGCPGCNAYRSTFNDKGTIYGFSGPANDGV